MSTQSSTAEKLGVGLWGMRLFLSSSPRDSLSFQITGLPVALRHLLVPRSAGGEVIQFPGGPAPRFVSLRLG